MKKLADYQNGNTHVVLWNNGTKIRTIPDEESMKIDFPDSLDIKITNQCKNNCPYCYENSSPNGQHCNCDQLIAKLAGFPRGVELAIGGGNPFEHPQLTNLLIELFYKGFVCNMTINQKDIVPNIVRLNNYMKHRIIRGLGVSPDPNNLEGFIKDFKFLKDNVACPQNIVIHLILGIHSFDYVKSIFDNLSHFSDIHIKVLFLGYKIKQRGKIQDINNISPILEKWHQDIKYFFSKGLLSFDNLAIEQLNLKSIISKDIWEKHFLGEDFTFSMFIDAVEKTFSPNSTSELKTDWEDLTAIEYFKRSKNNI